MKQVLTFVLAWLCLVGQINAQGFLIGPPEPTQHKLERCVAAFHKGSSFAEMPALCDQVFREGCLGRAYFYQNPRPYVKGCWRDEVHFWQGAEADAYRDAIRYGGGVSQVVFDDIVSRLPPTTRDSGDTQALIQRLPADMPYVDYLREFERITNQRRWDAILTLLVRQHVVDEFCASGMGFSSICTD